MTYSPTPFYYRPFVVPFFITHTSAIFHLEGKRNEHQFPTDRRSFSRTIIFPRFYGIKEAFSGTPKLSWSTDMECSSSFSSFRLWIAVEFRQVAMVYGYQKQTLLIFGSVRDEKCRKICDKILLGKEPWLRCYQIILTKLFYLFINYY